MTVIGHQGVPVFETSDADPLPGVGVSIMWGLRSPAKHEGEDQRLEARAELDAMVGRDLFGLTRDEMEYIRTFLVVARKEREKFGSFRSRELILQWFE
ncbi:MAG TPA: hypothetical protein VF431_00725 [Candidatus Methylomirabilis sp.]